MVKRGKTGKKEDVIASQPEGVTAAGSGSKRRRTDEVGPTASASSEVHAQDSEHAEHMQTSIEKKKEKSTEKHHQKEQLSTAAVPFASLARHLHPTLASSLTAQGFTHATPIQAHALPLALNGRDLLCRAATGSGKTLAFLLPIAESILRQKEAMEYTAHTAALILAPTLELCAQITQHLQTLLQHTPSHLLTSLNLGSLLHFSSLSTTQPLQQSSAAAKALQLALEDIPDVLISTPSRALAALKSGMLSLGSIQHLVIDEADLILSYGHDLDFKAILAGAYLPKIYQAFLMSATLTADVDKLRGLVLRNPAVLKLEEGDRNELLTQYSVHCSEGTKFLLTFVLLKLKLIRGKSIVFVNTVERGFKLKLFLQIFGIRSCILNRELPINSRFHVVQEFNRGIYDIIIATDETPFESEEEPLEESEAMQSIDTKNGSQDDNGSKQAAQGGSKKAVAQNSEYGVSRGVDFVSVSAVINFDMPASNRSYTHRVGRTARAGASGVSLTFVVPQSDFGTEKHLLFASAKDDEQTFAKIQRKQKGAIKEWTVEWRQVEGFRYRADDALRSVTKLAIREARLKELKAAALSSVKLKAHFAENERDLLYLQQDRPLHTQRTQPEMKHVPAYLKPRLAAPKVEGNSTTGQGQDQVSFHKRRSGTNLKNKSKYTTQKKGGPAKKNPLKSFR